MSKMAKVTNKGFQKLVLILSSDDSINLMPKASVVLPEASVNKQMRNLEAKGILKIKKV